MMNLIPGNKYLFDTSVYIDLLRRRIVGRRLHYQARFFRVSTGYSIITETELWMGIRGLWTVGEHIEILRPYNRYFINVTIARNAGKLWRELKYKYNVQPAVPDCLIAATAQFYGLRLVSKNTGHMGEFTRFGITVDSYRDEEP